MDYRADHTARKYKLCGEIRPVAASTANLSPLAGFEVQIALNFQAWSRGKY
jgi:hypothetical protein